jgi:integrase
MFAAKNKRDEAPLFQNRLGNYRRRGDIDRAWQRVRVRAGLSIKPRALRFHDLRHTAASRAASAPNASLPNVQKFLRHRTLQTTLGYVHTIPDEVANERMFAALSMAAAGEA